MKCCGENVILCGIAHVVSGFPLHFMFYRGNLNCFSSMAKRCYLFTGEVVRAAAWMRNQSRLRSRGRSAPPPPSPYIPLPSHLYTHLPQGAPKGPSSGFHGASKRAYRSLLSCMLTGPIIRLENFEVFSFLFSMVSGPRPLSSVAEP